MKFGQTLYQRSVPKWAAYNVNYNELKNLIKLRTTIGTAVPVSIPGQSTTKWHDLEEELFVVLNDQYDNIALFLRSKHGEIDRRLSHLEKQVRHAQRSLQVDTLERPSQQSRRYQKLVREAEDIGEDIQSLSRFVGVQKTAFRKILKKYRKWTGSTSLQTRLDVEVFSSGTLQVDYAELLQRLSSQSRIIATDLNNRPKQVQANPEKAKSTSSSRSNNQLINKAALKGPIYFDVAMLTVPFGEVAGSAYYWIHPDNLDEAQALLMRHMRDLLAPSNLPGPSSEHSNNILKRDAGVVKSSHAIIFDNAQRFKQELNFSANPKIALTGRWNGEDDAVVVLSDLTPKSSSQQVVSVRRKDLHKALQKDITSNGTISLPKNRQLKPIQDYLAENRDVKALAEVHSQRSRFVGITNSSEVGSWATLDTSILMANVDFDRVGTSDPDLEAGEAFPHAVLHVRWEFTRIPEIVRALDSSYFVERVHKFSLEEAAVYTVCSELEQPIWRELLQKDIRKVPITTRVSKATVATKPNVPFAAPVSSGPSSTDGPSESIFSVNREQSSATSDGFTSDPMTSPVTSKHKEHIKYGRKKKRAQIATPSQPSIPQRYWNEFDDGDSDVNQDEAYTIYVDPNQEVFPGAQTVSKAFAAMYQSLNKGKKMMTSWLPMDTQSGNLLPTERSPLLFGSHRGSYTGSEADLESSSSENEESIPHPIVPSNRHSRAISTMSRLTASSYRPHQYITPRQRQIETTLLQFYTGLIALSYILLAMSGILISAGRRKAAVQVDAGVVVGVAVALSCAIMSGVLMFMRRQPLSIIHRGLMSVCIATSVIIGIALLASIFI